MKLIFWRVFFTCTQVWLLGPFYAEERRCQGSKNNCSPRCGILKKATDAIKKVFLRSDIKMVKPREAASGSSLLLIFAHVLLLRGTLLLLLLHWCCLLFISPHLALLDSSTSPDFLFFLCSHVAFCRASPGKCDALSRKWWIFCHPVPSPSISIFPRCFTEPPAQ